MTIFDSTIANKDKLRLDLALDIAEICMLEVSHEDRKVTYLENAYSVFGCSDEVALKKFKKIEGLPFDKYISDFAKIFVHPDDHDIVKQTKESLQKLEPFSSELRLLQSNGKYAWIKFTIQPLVKDGQIISTICVMININSSKRKIIKLEKSNKMDSFTEVYNKTSTFEIINKEIENSNENDRFAFAITDINEFKKFNDTYGHDVGDEILIEAAKKLRKLTNDKNTIVGRFGGDEFIILFKHYKDRKELIRRIKTIYEFKVREYSCTSSCGISILNEDANTFSRLFKHADKALYESKRSKQPIVFYSDIKK